VLKTPQVFRDDLNDDQNMVLNDLSKNNIVGIQR
jgi:hypothetical protein